MKFSCSLLLVIAVAISCPNYLQAEEFKLWHKVELQFKGPDVNEQSMPNPFTDYRLDVTFTCGEENRLIRGFYSADGNAAESSATCGNVWKVRFCPEKVGVWHYEAKLFKGTDAAINAASSEEEVKLVASTGSFNVVNNSEQTKDFRTRGKLIADGRNYRFAHSEERWLKGGCDSPENLLAFKDFDGTYRIATENSEGEAKTTKEIHSYAPHLGDWKEGDATWQGGKGKALVGGLNYLSSVGINSIYFLTLNIEGDGKDVWPYRIPTEFDRFDCSRLDQWEIVFSHMQELGIALHVVTQETENERMLDDGNTGRLRKLYYRELISRFAHHPALVWNLGEENGPADFSPNGQTAEQQKAMATYFKQNDPYNHPVVIHTHSTAAGKEEVLHDLLGHKDLDGLSFQVNEPKRVNKELQLWQELSSKSGHTWMIGMDEIGPWHTGVVPDNDDPTHDSLRRNVLWGSLLGGANGVEWYFGAKFPHNDLTSEDWRQRESMWRQTTIARKFFEEYLPYWEMEAANELTSKESHCFAKPGEIYAIYVDSNSTNGTNIDLAPSPKESSFKIHWFSPTNGGELQTGNVTSVQGGQTQSIGLPPSNDSDWVALIRRQ